MKKAALIITPASLAVIVLYPGSLAYKTARDHAGDAMVLALIPVLEEAKRASGTYPARYEIGTSKVRGILPGPKVTYHPDKSSCDIYYYQWPLGPHHVFECRKNGTLRNMQAGLG